MILGLRFNKNLFALIHLSQELLPGAITYSSIIFIGAIFAAVYNYESAILRAHGNSVVLDLFFVIICHMGIAGVTYATIIAELICCLLCYMYMKKKLDILDFEKKTIVLTYNV